MCVMADRTGAYAAIVRGVIVSTVVKSQIGVASLLISFDIDKL